MDNANDEPKTQPDPSMDGFFEKQTTSREPVRPQAEDFAALTLARGSEESFPVLKAFQAYLDQERERARRRVQTLTIVFVSSIVGLVILFGIAFAVFFGRMMTDNKTQQDRFLDYILHTRQETPAQTDTVTKDDLHDALRTLLAEERKSAEAEAEARRKMEAEARAKAEAEVRAKMEAEAKAKVEAEARAKAAAAAKRKREAEARAKAEAEARAKAEAEAKAKREAEAKAKREAEARAKAEADAKAKREAEARAAEAAKPKTGVVSTPYKADRQAAFEAEEAARKVRLQGPVGPTGAMGPQTGGTPAVRVTEPPKAAVPAAEPPKAATVAEPDEVVLRVTPAAVSAVPVGTDSDSVHVQTPTGAQIPLRTLSPAVR